MKIQLNDVLSWLCCQCGYIWPVRNEMCPPARCAKCRASGWDEDRQPDGELPGA